MRRQDSRFQKVNTWRFLALLALPAGGAFAWDWGTVGARIMAAGIAGYIGYKLANAAEYWAVRRYRCPKCHADLGTDFSDWESGRDVILYCETCDVEWDPGVRSRQPNVDEDDD